MDDFKIVVGDDGEVESNDFELSDKPKRKRKPLRRSIRFFTIVFVSSVLLILSSVGGLVLYYLIGATSQSRPICYKPLEQIAVGGSSVLFQQRETEGGQGRVIFGMELNSGQFFKVPGDVYSLDLSEDEMWIIESRYETTVPHFVIYSLKIDSNGRWDERRLTEGKYPSWSSDGSRIAFFRDTDSVFVSALYIMNADGTNIRHLRDVFSASSPPSWSPDGSQLLFSASSSSHEDAEGRQLYIIDVDGNNPDVVIDNELSPKYPSWSPDGKRIAYVSHDVYTINLDGSDRQNLTDSKFSAVAYPQWLPNSKNIVFLGYNPGQEGIYRVDDDGTGLYLVYPQWCVLG